MVSFEDIQWKTLASYVVVAGVASVSSVSIYKLFFEREKDLVRRINRRIPQGHAVRITSPEKQHKPIRVWMDGCFDMMHFGHANAFRQGKALGDVLIVGVNPDSEIIKHKGPPIMNDQERLTAVRGCKWVDEVVENVPYAMDQEYIDMIIKKYDVDYIVHGDDECLDSEGNDVYATAKALGKFRTIKRTEGVSTTDIVGRMLTLDKKHFVRKEPTQYFAEKKRGTQYASGDDDASASFEDPEADLSFEPIPSIRPTAFLPTAYRIHQFSSGRAPRHGEKIVYIDGAWDMFHAGHIRTLQKAKALGDFLLVGIHSDDVVNSYRGSNYPILNLHERTLGVLQCRYVDEVIIGAPLELTRDAIITMNISVVVSGSTGDIERETNTSHVRVAKEMGIYQEISSDYALTTDDIVNRIFENRMQFEKKFEAKSAKEQAYNENQKEFVEEL